MKRHDLEAGGLYAVNHEYNPCMLLSAEIHEEFFGGKVRRYRPAPDHKPARNHSRAWGFDKRDYGLLFLEGDPTALATINDAARTELLAWLHENDYVYTALPENTRLALVTSYAAIKGPYERVRAREQDACAARDAALRGAAERYNAIIDALNPALGDLPLYRAGGHSTAQEITLTLVQAERIAVALRAATWEA